MALSAQRWSINALSVELAMDRRRLGRCVEEVAPAGRGPHGDLFKLIDVLRVLYPGGRNTSREDAWDDAVTYYGELLDEQLESGLAARLASSRSPARCARLLREAVASAVFDSIRVQEDPETPNWSKSSESAFSVAFQALVYDGAPLAEVAGIAAGTIAPPELEDE